MDIPEYVFRIAFGALWLIYFVVRIRFQKIVKMEALEYKRINEKKEDAYFRLFALAFLFLIFYFLSPWIDFAHIVYPIWIRWAGALLLVLGIALFAWSHAALAKNWTAVLALSDQHELVVTGPYHWVRHPMYSAFFVIGIGFFLLSANWLIGLVYLLPLIVMYITRVGVEENMMIEQFGDQYRKYMKTTGRLFPRIGN
jgi:protein-S-isoprenylcysteine O-methyltransferase Ste14